MAKSITVTPKKKRGRPATGRDTLLGARFPDELIDQIRVWAKANETTRSEAIRRLVEQGLKGKAPR